MTLLDAKWVEELTLSGFFTSALKSETKDQRILESDLISHPQAGLFHGGQF